MRITNVVLAAVAACSLGLGGWARFRGLGSAPLAVDEFFIVRSVENLLQHGLPQFACGGLYMRGLLLQYGAAFLTLLGLSSTTAPRIISGLCSLLSLPAAFLVARRVGGIASALLAVSVLALSVWETEMARFARMYAPFQAVFLWYLVYFLRWSVDGDHRAGRAMAILTVVGAVLWEGGLLLAIANFIPLALRRPSLQLTRADWRAVAGYLALLIAVYWFIATDFRAFHSMPAFPSDYDPLSIDSIPERFPTMPALWITLLSKRVWLALFAMTLFSCVAAVGLLWRRGELARTSTLLLMTALAAALAHQFIVTAAMLLLPMLFRFSAWRELTCKKAWPAYTALILCAAFWVSFAYLNRVPASDMSSAKNLLTIALPLVSFPDVVNQLIVPWAPAVPALGLGLVLLLSVVTADVLSHEEPGVSARRAVLVLVVCLLLATCASGTPRHETRYVFFLYPALVILAISGIGVLVRRLAAPPVVGLTTALAVLAAFALSEDFQPRHLLEVNQPQIIFARDKTPAQQSHLVVRDDTRAIAAWLQRNAVGNGKVVISAFQSLDYYAPEVAYFYVARDDFNYESYACRRGSVERWSNRALLSSVPDLERVIGANAQTYLVTYADRLGPLLQRLSRYHPTIELSLDHLAVVRFSAAAQNGTGVT